MEDDVKKNLELFYEHALKLLARRPQSEFELRRKLTRFGYKRKIKDSQIYIDQIVEQLKTKNLIDDAAFAKWYAIQRQDFKPRSKIRLKSELSKKGIDQQIIDQALESYDEELACRTLAHRKRHMDNRRLTDYLLRNGFPYDLVESIVVDQKDF